MKVPTRELGIIQAAIRREGRIEGKFVVVPEDFFQRLNKKLNECNPPSIIDHLLEAIAEDFPQ